MDHGAFVELDTAQSRFTAPQHLTLRFHVGRFENAPVLRIGFAYDRDDKEICWLTHHQMLDLYHQLGEFLMAGKEPKVDE